MKTENEKQDKTPNLSSKCSHKTLLLVDNEEEYYINNFTELIRVSFVITATAFDVAAIDKFA